LITLVNITRIPLYGDLYFERHDSSMFLRKVPDNYNFYDYCFKTSLRAELACTSVSHSRFAQIVEEYLTNARENLICNYFRIKKHFL